MKNKINHDNNVKSDKNINQRKHMEETFFLDACWRSQLQVCQILLLMMNWFTVFNRNLCLFNPTGKLGH